MTKETKAGEIRAAKAGIKNTMRMLESALEKIALAEKHQGDINHMLWLNDASTLVRSAYCASGEFSLQDADRALVAIHSGVHQRATVTFEVFPAALPGEIRTY